MTRLLVVDDDAQVRQVLRRLLPAHALTCDAVATVDEAIAAIRSEPPDVVLLDVTLGNGSGLDVLRSLRAQSPRQPPVVLMTARRDLFAEMSTELGSGDDWVTKPWDLEELVARLYLAIRRARASRSA